MTDPAAPPPLDRPDLYVVARFLARLAEPDRSYTKSRLQLAVRVNYDLFRRYLAFLERKEFVRVESDERGGETVRLTPQGLDAYHHLCDWIRRVLGETLI